MPDLFSKLWQHRTDLCERLPSQAEQETAEQHCCIRPLDRPDTDVRKAVASAFLFLGVNATASCALYMLLDGLGLFSRLPESFHAFAQAHAGWWRFFFWLAVNLIGFLACLRSIIIGILRLYQHYAPEEIRRRCIFMPTCSEYGVLALKKYGALIGLLKTYDRLIYRCRGNIYRIDYP